ncbi:hypothetical protein HH310_26385 [Actinoplanes sp. TBRC 11911]|uniref:recombinase family protein n=1 Tax=Actinoplanes sp. TBRC 11911 TaxID=2729386 RepID=UPI00145D5E75|nr:recombinase family protein [Actinoplanes sp. TBRC 11911]NMO54702.1 hypothetical protein [Actinoplanes sp. TBRC 11911]
MSRPPQCPRVIALRILADLRLGTSYRQICASLNADRVPTPGGSRRWYPSHLSRLRHTTWFHELEKTGNTTLLLSRTRAGTSH